MARNERIWQALNHFRTSRWGVLLFYGYLIGILVAALIAAFAITDNHRLAVSARNAATLATRSLCLQKNAARVQLDGAKKYLHDHPDGTPDFSRALILNAIHTDKINVAALHDVQCSRTAR
jgi:hypothetical protein